MVSGRYCLPRIGVKRLSTSDHRPSFSVHDTVTKSVFLAASLHYTKSIVKYAITIYASTNCRPCPIVEWVVNT
jgi:hypothetical protein